MAKDAWIRRLLSERYRPIALPLLVALLVSLCAHWVSVHLSAETGYMRLLQTPLTYHGEQVVLSLVTVGEALGDARYLVHEGTLTLQVIGPYDEVEEGREYTILGTWDGQVEAVRAAAIHEATGRPAKKALGIFALLAAGLILPAFFMRAEGGIAIRG